MGRQMANRRVAKELSMLSRGSAAPGIAAWPRDDTSRLDLLDAEICGAADTPYEGGVFKLELTIPPEYPLKPPRVRFLTKIYHPNIDSQGRICLDSLNMPPKGAWKPSLNIATLLTSIQALMSSPNPDDGLMVDITDEYRRNPELFRRKAIQCTDAHARPNKSTKALASSANASTEDALPANEIEPEPVTQPNVKLHPTTETNDNPLVICSDSDEEPSSSRLRKKPRYS